MEDPRMGALTENVDGRYLLWHVRIPTDGVNKEGEELALASHSFGIYDSVEDAIQIEYAAELFGMLIPNVEKPMLGKLKEGSTACSVFDLLGRLQREGMQLMHVGFFDFHEKEEKQDA